MKPILIDGALCLATDSGEIYARDLTAYLSYPGNDYNIITAPSVGEWVLEDGIARTDNVTMEFTPHGDGVLVRTTYKNLGERLENPGRFYCLAATLTDTPRKVQITRFTDDNGNLVNEMRSQIDTVIPVWGARYESADFVVYSADKANGIFGFATYERYFGGVDCGGDGRYQAFQILEEHPLEWGGTVTSDLVLITPCGDIVREALPEMADLIRELSVAECGDTQPEREVPVGFCTWYYYASRINLDIMRENMDALDAHRKDIPVKYIQIDDGWFDCWGSWEAKENFEHDMRAFAEEVKNRGYIPGIWVAPFGSATEAPVFKEHPEYFVNMKCGLPWPRPAFDFSHPGACEYIRDLFHRLSHEWGYRYIKMDIITGRLAPAVHSDPDFTTIKNYRKGLRIMREAVTDDTFLLACTAPLAPAAGLVDGMRVSCDVFERWESLRDVFNSVIKRYYIHKKWYINDADCLLVRTADEEDEQCWRLCTRTEGEIRTYVTAMAASGGALMLSDKMPLLKEYQFSLISKLFPLNTEAALPLDLMDSFIPGVLDFGTRKGVRTVALINWADAPAKMTVPESGDKLCFEFWAQEFMGQTDGDVTATVEPHGCRVFFLTDAVDGAAVGTDASVVMDISPDGCGGWRKNKEDETLFIARKVEDGWYTETV